MLRLRNFLVLVLLFAISACSQSPGSLPDVPVTPTFTPYVGGTQTALAVSVAQTQTAFGSSLPTLAGPGTSLPTSEIVSYPTITPSSTPLISLTPTTTPTPAVMPSDFSPVLLGKKYNADTFFSLLGGIQAGQWLTADQAAALMSGASEYDIYTFAKGMVQVYGYAPEKSMINGGYFLSTDATLGEVGMVGMVHGWHTRQGDVEELSSENEFYRQVVLDWLSQAGVADPQIGTIQIHRTDLEGDGTDEIFISATRVESQHTAIPGDHSMILMRKVTGNEAVTIPILVDLYAYVNKSPINPFPCTYSIGNFIDLNQDGVLEVVVEFERWEGFGAAVYQIDGRNVEEVLGNTCITP